MPPGMFIRASVSFNLLSELCPGQPAVGSTGLRVGFLDHGAQRTQSFYIKLVQSSFWGYPPSLPASLPLPPVNQILAIYWVCLPTLCPYVFPPLGMLSVSFSSNLQGPGHNKVPYSPQSQLFSVFPWL